MSMVSLMRSLERESEQKITDFEIVSKGWYSSQMIQCYAKSAYQHFVLGCGSHEGEALNTAIDHLSCMYDTTAIDESIKEDFEEFTEIYYDDYLRSNGYDEDEIVEAMDNDDIHYYVAIYYNLSE